jgi:hypothetical protein
MPKIMAGTPVYPHCEKTALSCEKNEQKSSRHVLPEDGKLKNIAVVISSRRSFSEVPHGRTFDGKTPDDHVCFHGVSH